MENDYYIAADKTEHPDSTSNMQVMMDEVIQLAYLCDSWVRYAIVTGHIDRFSVSGSSLTYMDALSYLNRMTEYLSVQKEDPEATLIQADIRHNAIVLRIGKRLAQETDNWHPGDDKPAVRV